MDSVFQALAHADRRRILDVLTKSPACSVNDVCRYFRTSRIAVMKHLRVLQSAGLVHSEKQGRTRKLFFNAVPIQMIYDRWTTQYSGLWAARLTGIKYRVESKKGKPRGTRDG